MKTEKIVLIQLENKQALLPHQVLIKLNDPKELHTKLKGSLPDLIVVSEAFASETIAMFQEYLAHSQESVECEIAVVIDKLNVTASRRWAAEGATSVWGESDWEKQIFEFGGGAASLITSNEIVEQFNSTQVIALASVDRGVGTTHTALMLATYIQKKWKAKVAIWEGVPPKTESLSNLILLFNDHSKLINDFEAKNAQRRVHYDVNGITIFPAGVDEESIEEYQEEYQYIIYDLGCLSQLANPGLFFKAQVPILIGSGSPWKKPQTTRVINEHSHRKTTRVRVLLPLASEEDTEEVASVLRGRLVYAMPCHPDVFKLQADSNEVIEALINMIQPSMPKGGWTRRLFSILPAQSKAD